MQLPWPYQVGLCLVLVPATLAINSFEIVSKQARERPILCIEQVAADNASVFWAYFLKTRGCRGIFSGRWEAIVIYSMPVVRFLFAANGVVRYCERRRRYRVRRMVPDRPSKTVTGELLLGVTLEVVPDGRYVIKPPSMSVENSDVFWRAAEAPKLQPISFQENYHV